MTSRRHRQPDDTPRFSRLEKAVMQALAWELRSTVPDLDAQFEIATAGRRMNTGSGFHHQIIGDRNRLAPQQTPTGLFGSVHAMIDGLQDAVLFQVQLREGRLLALIADAYDQDTRHVDFMTTGFEQVFYLEADGASRPFDPSVLVPGNRPEPGPPVHRYAPPPTDRPAPTAEQRAADTLRSALKGAAHSVGIPTATPEPAGAPMDTATLKIGVWVALAALALIAVIFGAPIFFAIFGTVFIGRALTRQAALDAIARALADRRWRPDG